MQHRIFCALFIIFLAGCAAAQSTNPEQARELMLSAWQANQHAVWELDWPNAPAGGPVTFEVWQARPRYRLEILESPAPALMGEMLVFDGQRAHRANRLSAQGETTLPAPQLSPVTGARALVDGLLQQNAAAAEESRATVRGQSAQKITLQFADGSRLAMWILPATGLPLKIEFAAGSQRGTLTARHVEPLNHPPAELFEFAAQ
ncbi:MAG: hypothetical protein D6768_18340 [Chloroflexi bacterium]|nr:MAG: hypothetical protein D6768_18340 [Chloroflexota bacterium]